MAPRLSGELLPESNEFIYVHGCGGAGREDGRAQRSHGAGRGNSELAHNVIATGCAHAYFPWDTSTVLRLPSTAALIASYSQILKCQCPDTFTMPNYIAVCVAPYNITAGSALESVPAGLASSWQVVRPAPPCS